MANDLQSIEHAGIDGEYGSSFTALLRVHSSCNASYHSDLPRSSLPPSARRGK